MRFLRRLTPWFLALGIVLLAAGAFAVRCHNLRDVFVEGGVYFIDADCYSRMTRARMVAEHPGTVVRFQDFENYPQGVRSHATAPLDYLIAGLKWTLDPLLRPTGGTAAAQTLDLAGALVSPLLGAVATALLGWWGVSRWGLIGSETPRWHGLAAPLLFAISPIAVHGTLLGRPDHQSLELLFVAAALAAGWTQRPPSLVRRALEGACWGMALWVSLYEPAILLFIVLLTRGVLAWQRREAPDRRALAAWSAGFLAPVLAATFIDGWHIALPAAEHRDAAFRWAQTIGELKPLDLEGGALFRWLGLACVAAPVLLWLARRRSAAAWLVLVLLLAVFGLTLWQLRWGYFLVLVYAMSLPLQLAVCRAWVGWPLLLIGLFPLAQDWDEELFPSAEQERQIAMRRKERLLLRDAAEWMRASPGRQPFLAPWWLAPPLAYWSGQPAISGSSHQSLPGTIDSARFYLATDPAEVAPILAARSVSFIFADDPGRAISTSATILGIEEPPARPLAVTIMENPATAAPYLVPAYANQFYGILAVDRANPLLTPPAKPTQ